MSRRVLVALAAVPAAVLVVGAGGCGSSDTGSSAAASSGGASAGSASGGSTAAASSGQALCDTAGDLRTSVTALQQVDVVQQGTDAVQQAFGQVSTDISTLADAARAQFKPQVVQVQADRDAVQAALAAAKAAPNVQTLGALRVAVQQLGRDVQTLLSAVGSTC